MNLLCLFLTLAACDDNVFADGAVDWLGPSVGYDESGADLYLPVAAVAMASDADKATSVARILDTIDTVTSEQPDVRVIVFPEMAVGWYWVQGDLIARPGAALRSCALVAAPAAL